MRTGIWDTLRTDDTTGGIISSCLRRDVRRGVLPEPVDGLAHIAHPSSRGRIWIGRRQRHRLDEAWPVHRLHVDQGSPARAAT
jgi:hypothetical protein